MASADNIPAAKEKTYSGFVTLLMGTVPTVANIGLIDILLNSGSTRRGGREGCGSRF
jgi:hypothetical protein